jgi:hypothetical protein
MLDPPGSVADQTDGPVAFPIRSRAPSLNSNTERSGSAAGEAGVRAPDGIEDVGIGAPELRPMDGQVQAMRHLVVEIETRSSVLDLDGIEVEFGGAPPHPVDTSSTAAAFGAPEGVDGDRDAPLIVDGMDRGRGRHAGRDVALEKEAENVPLAARHLFADDHSGRTPTTGGVVRSAEGPLNGVMVGDGDHVQAGIGHHLVNDLLGSGPTITETGMDMKVGTAPL